MLSESQVPQLAAGSPASPKTAGPSHMLKSQPSTPPRRAVSRTFCTHASSARPALHGRCKPNPDSARE
jgi:hypothetical protein